MKVCRVTWIHYFNAPFFCCSLFFEDISTPRLESKKGKQCWLPPLSFKISRKDASYHISINFSGLYLSPKCLLNFFSLAYSTICREIFKFMVFTFTENVFNLGIFTHFYTRRRKLLLSHAAFFFFENLLPPKAERSGANFDLLYRNSIRKYEDDFEH